MPDFSERIARLSRAVVRSVRGAALIEFAIIGPFLFLLMLGLIEFGFVVYDKAVITNASREGARHAIVFRADSDGAFLPFSDAEITQVVNDYVEQRLVNFAAESVSVTVEPDFSTRQSSGRGQPLTVAVSYKYDFLVLPGVAPLLGEKVDITAQTVMRME